MDTVELVAFARELIDIDSTTGREAEAGQWVANRLRAMGYHVLEQALPRGCSNVLAMLAPPRVVLSTHYDCVPPFFPSREEDGVLYGRGSCDAKGILAAQVAAVERLRASGETVVGLLFVAGEERGSDGAMAANRLASDPGQLNWPGQSCRFLVNGEPTGNKLGLATRGVLRVRLEARGRAAHSSMPEQGVSAIDKLIDALVRLRSLDLPSDPSLGQTFYTVGLIEGGNAPNVIPAHAWAEVLFRSVGSADALLDVVRTLEPAVEVQEILRVPPVRLHTVPGFETEVFPFTTDIPFLDCWGTPLLYGPGSVLVAHTDDEHVAISELETAVDGYERLARACLV